MATRYQVVLKDAAGAQAAIITDWRTLEIRRRVNGPDSHFLEIDGDLSVVDSFVLDGQVEVYRQDEASSPAIPLTLEYEGFHRTEIRRTDDQGRSTYASNGRGYVDLLNRRLILYPNGSVSADKSGVGETVMKAYVNENAGPAATFPPRLLASGVTPGLTIQVDGAAGSAWTGSRAYRNLLEILQEIAKATDVDFTLVGTGVVTFEFRAQAAPIGADRTNTGVNPATGLNSAGNVPVVFSLDFGNMEEPAYARNRVDEVNAFIVLGQGVEAARTVIQRTNATAIADSSFNRHEALVNGTEEDTTPGLNAIGDAALEKNLRAQETFFFQAMQITSLIYGRDYFVGDRVTARYKTIQRNIKIVGVDIVVAEGREDISLLLGDLE